MSKPSHIAYVVNEERKNGKRESYWRTVGAVWPHKNGNGFDLVIYDQLSVGGRIVCTAPKEEESCTPDPHDGLNI